MRASGTPHRSRPHLRVIPLWLLAALLAAGGANCFESLQARGPFAQQREESDSYYQKWLEEDVLYIITPDERAVFLKLTTNEERDRFIEEFWRRRDPDPGTAENEFKTEHYRRIAYTNERYFSGIPGWKSDRGQIYIKFGPPDSIERQPAGGLYRRRNSEGGGETTVFPFERWWYSHIDGIGDDIEIEFVDKSRSNEYRISLNPQEKDAFLYIDGHGNTQAEFEGTARRAERITAPLGVDRSNPFLRRADLPFERLRRFAQIQKAPEIRHKHLQQIVETRVRYEQLPFTYRADWIRVGSRALAPITIGVREGDLQFGADGRAGQARLNVFGQVTGLNGQIAAIFDDDIVKDRTRAEASGVTALYQKMVLLDPGRYRLDLVVEDGYSGKIGYVRAGLVIPAVDEQKLQAGPVILVEKAQPIEPDAAPQMFRLGNHKILPRMSNRIPPLRYLLFYLELYNAGIDASSAAPLLDLTYQLVDERGVAAEKQDAGARRAVLVSDQRVALLEYLSLDQARSDSLKLRIVAEDRVTGQTLSIEYPVLIQR